MWIADTDALAINRPDTIRHSSRPGKVLTFLTTMEYEDYVKKGRIAKYSQSGAREITIPFNYKDTNGRFALLHVKELGGGIDTIVGQDSKLAVNFLPGEGKIFRVEIVRPNEVAGELAHSNQTKIVTYPIMRYVSGKWKESDTIAHYMTYHKQIPGRGTGWMGVFFRKSKPASKHDNGAAIQWDATEYLLSDSVFHNGVWNWCDTCMYPSIVTRFDSLSQEYRSYVVYGCISDTVGKSVNSQYIVESVVRVANDTVVVGSVQGKSFEGVGSRDLAEWGTPMINASDSLNFYCWSEPFSGIRAGWKVPRATPDTLTEGALNIHWGSACPGGVRSAKHPSMNPYSRYMLGEHEQDCALVWQEADSCGKPPRIFYTRLLWDGHNIVYDLPSSITTNVDDSIALNYDSTIACVSTPFSDIDFTNTFPVVNRDLTYPETDTSICQFSNYYYGYNISGSKFDNIYWSGAWIQPYSFYSIVCGFIVNRNMWIRDTVINTYTPSELQVFPISVINHASEQFLDQPVVSAGEAFELSYTGWSLIDQLLNCLNFSKRGVNLNFRCRPVDMFVFGDPIFADSLALIYHYPQYMVGEPDYNDVSIVDKGLLSYPHLAERGSLYKNDWQRNHRIYNRHESSEVIPAPPATIRSSGQYFFRTSGEHIIAQKFYSFGHDSLSFGVASVIVGEQEYKMKNKHVTSPYDFIKSPDTLSTDWFKVGDLETMDAITTGACPDRMSVWLERQNDGARWDITLTAGDPLKIARETVELLNGDNEEYCLRICSNNHAPYHLQTTIGDEETSFGKASSKGYSQINLGDSDPSQTVFIYPNPAREEVNLTIKGDKRSEVIIVSAVGGEATRFFTEGGKTVTVNTSTFPSGMYVVRVRRDGIVDAVVPFVIVR